MLDKSVLDELKMTPKKRLIVKHMFGWYCSTCAALEWYNSQSTRNTEFEGHIQKSPTCKNVMGKCDKQDVSPRSSQVR